MKKKKFDFFNLKILIMYENKIMHYFIKNYLNSFSAISFIPKERLKKNHYCFSKCRSSRFNFS